MNSTSNNTPSTDPQNADDCSWFLTSEEIMFFLHTNYSRILFTIVIPLVSSLGIVINGTFLYVVIRVKEMRTIPNFYLGSLAVGDILFMGVQRTIEILSYVNSPIRMEVFGFVFSTRISCTMVNMAGYIFYFNSIFMIVVSTVDRYLAICKPVYYREISSKKRAVRLVIGCWIAALLCAGFQGTYNLAETVCLQWPAEITPSPQQSSLKLCSTSSPWAPLATLTIDLTAYILASFTFAFCSISIILTLNKRISSHIAENKQDETVHARNQISKMVLVNSSIFILCLAPFQFFNVDWAYYNLTGFGLLPEKILTVLAITGMITMSINSLINPLVYLAVSARYRQAYKSAFYCCRS